MDNDKVIATSEAAALANNPVIKNACKISVPRCPTSAAYQGVFIDTYLDVATNSARCLNRASEYQNWCKTKSEVTASFINSSGTVTASQTAPALPNLRCEISISQCANTSYVGVFNDPYAPAQSSQPACLQRAVDYQSWCQSKKAVTASYFDNYSLIAAKTAPALGVTRCEIRISRMRVSCLQRNFY